MKNFILAVVAIIVLIIAGAIETWYLSVLLGFIGGWIIGGFIFKAYMYDKNK